MGVSLGPPNSLAQAHLSQLRAERAALGAVNYQDRSLAWAGRWQASDLGEPAPYFRSHWRLGLKGLEGERTDMHVDTDMWTHSKTQTHPPRSGPTYPAEGDPILLEDDG